MSNEEINVWRDCVIAILSGQSVPRGGTSLEGYIKTVVLVADLLVEEWRARAQVETPQ